MVTAFAALPRRLARLLRPLPLYIGHPDDSELAARYEDKDPVGEVAGLEARADGLYLLPRWNERGRALLDEGRFAYLSPRWSMRPLGGNRFRPQRLLSVGLTNNPNIPGERLPAPRRSFSPTEETEPALAASLAALLDIPKESAPSDERLLDTVRTLQKSAERAEHHRAEAARLREEVERQEALVRALEADLSTAQNARIESALDTATREGRLAAHERPQWQQRLQADPEEGLTALSNHRPALKTASTLGELRPPADPAGARERFLSAVQEQMRQSGSDYAAAWKRAREHHRDLYEQLSLPA